AVRRRRGNAERHHGICPLRGCFRIAILAGGGAQAPGQAAAALAAKLNRILTNCLAASVSLCARTVPIPPNAAVMNLALGKWERRQRALSARRRTAEGSAARERARNARIALAGFVLLGAAITFGVHTTWGPPKVKITSMRLPADAASLKFAENHIGRL